MLSAADPLPTAALIPLIVMGGVLVVIVAGLLAWAVRQEMHTPRPKPAPRQMFNEFEIEFIDGQEPTGRHSVDMLEWRTKPLTREAIDRAAANARGGAT